MRRGAKRAKAKVKAKRPAVRKSKRNEGARVRDLEKRLAESQEQQAATAEILKVISGAPTDTQPVFEAIVNSTQRLMAGKSTVLLLRRDPQFVVGAYAGPAIVDLPDQVRAAPLDREQNFPSRAILDAEIVHVPDWEADDVPEHERVVGRSFGIRAGLMVPLLREGQGIGALVVTRSTAGPYDEKEIALLRSFADQAVIAIENVRLFTELEQKNRALSEAHAQVTEALEQQTATSEILGVISSSSTDIQPVFDTLAESAARLCESFDAYIFLRDGDRMRLVANYGPISTGPIGEFTLPLVPGTVVGRTVLDGRAIHVADLQTEVEEYPEGSETARRRGHRAILSVPLMREGVAIGAIGVRRTVAQFFTDRQVALLKTFADQAVIAIENVRLFTELREKNDALTLAHAQVSETLEQQTATAEILRVISSSPTDVQPVFDVIVARAVHLCGARFGRVYRFDDGVIHMVAGHGISPGGFGELQRVFPRPASDDTIVGRVILSRQPIFVRDIERGEGVPALSRRMIEALGTRSQVTIPMLRVGNRSER